MIASISGPIASGKTTLGRKTAELLGWKFVPEPENNPFLDAYYRDPARWSFQSQMHFLIEFYKAFSLDDILNEENIILDRNAHESVLFARAQLEMGYMQPSEFQTYMSYFNELDPEWPELIILIDMPPSVSVSRILARQRPCEMSMHQGDGRIYLKKLHDIYKAWKPECDVIRLDYSELDRRIINNPAGRLADIISTWKSQNMPKL